MCQECPSLRMFYNDEIIIGSGMPKNIWCGGTKKEWNENSLKSGKLWNYYIILIIMTPCVEIMQVH